VLPAAQVAALRRFVHGGEIPGGAGGAVAGLPSAEDLPGVLDRDLGAPPRGVPQDRDSPAPASMPHTLRFPA
jgi:hypothetical protein